MTEPKILFLDIETAPNIAMIWSIWNTNIHIQNVLESSYVLCWAAKWKGSNKVMFDSVQKSGKDGAIKSIYKLLDEADVIVHYNGRRFDIPVLHKEFLIRKMSPPKPFKQIDLYQSIKKKFMFVSHKLDYISKQLGLKGKVIHNGHQMWLDCMNGKKAAWDKMKEYNIGDVVELEKVYNIVLPWIDSHPNYGLYNKVERPVCTNCGTEKVLSKGYVHTKTQTYKRWVCTECGTYMRSIGSEKSNKTKVKLTQVVEN